MNTRATLEGERLVVVTTGNRGSAFTVTFDPVQNGQSLEMTRTIDDETLRAPVTVRSFYRRLSDEARWNFGDGARGSQTRPPASRRVISACRMAPGWSPSWTTRSARRTPIGDVYTMTTRSPSQYEGAVIQGVVSGVNGPEQASGRVGMAPEPQEHPPPPNAARISSNGVIDEIRTPDGQNCGDGPRGTLDTHNGQSQKARGAWRPSVRRSAP
jgi:hypothetical protein